MARFLLRRVVSGAAVVVFTAVFAYGGWRLLQNQDVLSGTWSDLKLAAQLRFDYEGLPEKLSPDVWMVAGTLAFGLGLGVQAGTYCAVHRGSLRARVLEAVAMQGLCTPPLIAGYAALYLFEPTFGAFRAPVFFDVHIYQEPWQDPWDWFRSLLVPWLIAGLPLFGTTLRLTLAATADAEDEEFMRTAIAKGLPPSTAIRRHARPAGMPAVLAFMSAGSAAVVLNVTMVETIFSVPGLLGDLRAALGASNNPDIAGSVAPSTAQLVALWSAVIIVVVGLVFDAALAARDPRIRESGRPG